MVDPSLPEPAPTIEFADFLRVDIRAGTITDAQTFPETRRPSYRLWIDFGDPIGVRKTSAQVTRHYRPEGLIGRQVAAVVNFPPKQIARFMSEVLVLGFPGEEGEVVLVAPDRPVRNGVRLY